MTATTNDDQVRLNHKTAEIRGIRLHYVEAGEGPLVVLLHGFPDFWFSWRHQIPALAAAGFPVIAPDMRGYNLSDKPKSVDAYTIDELVADVAALIQSTGAARAAAVVGHDWGGGVAWAFAAKHPELLERLVILNAPHPARLMREFANPRQLAKSWYMFFFQLPKVPEAVLARDRFAAMRASFEKDMYRPGAVTPEEIARYVEAWSQPGALTATINYYRAMFRPAGLRAGGKPTRIDLPVLVIWGQGDRHLAPQLAEPDPKWVSNVKVVRLEDASHFVHMDRPEEVSREMIAFLKPAS